MPLSQPVARKLIHHRLIDCHGYEREDGLFDIEGRLTDTKSYGFDTILRGKVEAGDFIHDMKMRITVDLSLKIIDIDAVRDPHPYTNCGDITPNYKALIGERIISGFTKATDRAVGATRGCTHHTSLLRDLATVVFQTIGPLMAKRRREQGVPMKKMSDDLFKGRKPPMIDGCHALASDNANVERFFPKWYQPKDDQLLTND